MTLGRKLGLSFAAIALAVVALVLVSQRVAMLMGDTLQEASSSSAKVTGLVSRLQAGITDMAGHAKSMQLAHVIKKLEGAAAGGGKKEAPAMACAGCHPLSEAEEARREFDQAGAGLHALLRQLRPVMPAPKAVEALGTIEAGLNSWKQLYARYLQIASTDYEAAHAILSEEMVPVLVKLHQALDVLAEQQRQMMADCAARSAKVVDSGRTSTLALLGLSLLVIGVAVFFVIRATRQLRTLVETLSSDSVKLTTTSSEISGAGKAVAESAAEQTEALDRVAASGLEIDGTAREHVQNAKSAAEASHEVVGAIGEAKARLEELRTAIQEIGKATEGVTRIAKVIDEMAFQTNLLSVNATIEAARAGAAGSAFAVVADEVRSLSLRSSDSAREVASLIQTATAATSRGTARLSGVTEAFETISSRAATVGQLAEGIDAGSVRQAREVEEINRGIANIREATQRAASSAEQAATAGSEIATEANMLTGVIGRLVEMVGRE